MKLDDKLIKVMSLVAGGLILFILIIALFASCTKAKKYTIENIGELEKKLMTLAKNYYAANESSLPSEGSSTTLSIQSLVDNKKIKPLNEIIVKGENCSGSIKVLNNNGYYLYLPQIDCGSLYKTKSIADTLINDGNLVTSGNGLYASENGYVFRGDNVNNYIAFANRLWLILRVNNDGSVKIMEASKRDGVVWDDRYNPDRNYKSGINDIINNNINSRIKDRMEAIYNDEKEFDENAKAHMLKQSLCIGKRSVTDTAKDGSVECATTLDNQMVGLITVAEFLQASLDPGCNSTINNSCTNYNYISQLKPAFWTITADKDNSYKVYKVGTNVTLTNATNYTSIKLTALLSSELIIGSGEGTEENPYILVSSPYTPKK